MCGLSNDANQKLIQKNALPNNTKQKLVTGIAL